MLPRFSKSRLPRLATLAVALLGLAGTALPWRSAQAQYFYPHYAAPFYPPPYGYAPYQPAFPPFWDTPCVSQARGCAAYGQQE